MRIAFLPESRPVQARVAAVFAVERFGFAGDDRHGLARLLRGRQRFVETAALDVQCVELLADLLGGRGAVCGRSGRGLSEALDRRRSGAETLFGALLLRPCGGEVFRRGALQAFEPGPLAVGVMSLLFQRAERRVDFRRPRARPGSLHPAAELAAAFRTAPHAPWRAPASFARSPRLRGAGRRAASAPHRAARLIFCSAARCVSQAESCCAMSDASAVGSAQASAACSSARPAMSAAAFAPAASPSAC